MAQAVKKGRATLLQLNIDNFLYPYPTNAPYQIWLRLAHWMLINDGQRAKTDANP